MRKLFFCFFTILISSCINSNDKNLNTKNNKVSIIDNKYQFFEFLETNSNYSFYFEKYESKNQRDYLIVKIIGDNSSIIGKFRVITKGTTFDKLIQTKGIGYKGAELRNFKHEILGEELICVNVEKIID